MRELICIVCPRGCHMRVDGDLNVTGNFCPRGEAYAKAELTHPTRVVTSTVRITGAAYPRCPVKTAAPVPKEKIFDVMDAIGRVTLSAPVRVGQTVIEDVCGTGVAVVAAREMP